MESLNIAPESTPAAGPDDDALAEKGSAAVEAGNTHKEEQPAKQRPEWVPEKFWNPATGEVDTEGLAKSYKELEKSRSQDNKPEGNLRISSIDEAKNLAAEKGVDFNALAQEYDANGDLTEDTYKALEAKGISKDIVKQFVDGQKAQAAQMRTEALSQVGGEEKYAEMATWAKANLSEADLKDYNRAVSSSDMGVVKLAIAALQGKYLLANGKPPGKTVGGKSGGNSSNAEPFLSRQQYVDAIKDARYDRDPAYRNQVLKRLEASSIF